ncbi:hypothetical protein C474_09237 [Halogeometricum pallidum JCM 14848]|uniref:DUF8113 domain-containing protein n=1 Tax=Halogeometricum pallidum JCM 14848 TaxID=1227487 RepID=M0D9I8_HALPD|nr:hypothetical protein [Halogeometricum pallidum]ELZ31473.1 hypothetical protein C474_09237 [Halogeometricum pallidum JCM 14848]
MQGTTNHPSTGPRPGASPEEFRQSLRDAAALLNDDAERPESLFVAVQYRNGTDYVHAHADGADGQLDWKVYDLLSPLAVHAQQVAAAANADPEAVLECAAELIDSVEDPDRRGE